MLKINDAWLARETRRWMRPDAHRWMRPDFRRFLAPGERKAGFDPEQPRDDWGRWTETEEEVDDVEEFVGGAALDEFSDARRAQGHHFVARSICRDLPLSPETKAVFDRATTGPLAAQRHGYSQEHKIYNEAVVELFGEFVAKRSIPIEMMTPDQAREFVGRVKVSKDPRIRDLNIRILQREITHILRLRGRKLE